NQPTHTTDPLGHAVDLAYNPNGDLLTLTDQRGNQTVYTYDAMDRVLGRQDSAPIPKTESYTYDGDGNLTGFTDRRGTLTAYTYDALGRMGTIFYDKQGSAYDSRIDYTYDSGDRVTEIDDSASASP